LRPFIRKWMPRLAGLVALAILLWWALHAIPLVDILSAIQHLQWWQPFVILFVNLFIFICVTLRWWIIVQAEARKVPFLPLLAIRVSVFGVSYFTVGPQVGGEPLQVFSLQNKYGLSFTRAVASVFLDKLIEFLVDFILLAVGISSLLHAGLLTEMGIQRTMNWIILGILVLAPPSHIFLMSRKHHPVTALLNRLPFVHKDAKIIRFIRAAEWMAGSFVRKHPKALVGALGVSLLQAVAMLVDYALIVLFLGLHLPLWNTIAGWTAGWLAFLMPLPGGLGAVEASQVFALGKFGIPAAAALSVALIMRGRDVFIGGIGVLIAGRGWKSKPVSHGYPVEKN